jgi:hypothetical protein
MSDQEMMEEEPTLMVRNLEAAFSKKNIFDVSFSQCTIDIAILDPLNGGDVRIIDLSPWLVSMRFNQEFLPSSLYVRDCMRYVFALFSNDPAMTPSNDHRRVLLGSPGVGKSVLFFLVALEKAHDTDVPVLYLRKTREEKRFSIFLMQKDRDGIVSVFFCRM